MHLILDRMQPLVPHVDHVFAAVVASEFDRPKLAGLIDFQAVLHRQCREHYLYVLELMVLGHEPSDLQ
jgi:hypothetical protein